MDDLATDEKPETDAAAEADLPAPAVCVPIRPEIRPALEPTCCGSDCDDCPF
jgi:hypothetical protein